MASTAASTSRINEILERARKSENAIVQEAFHQELALRQKTKHEIEELLLAIQKQMSEQDYEKIQKETFARLKEDLELVNKLNAALQPLRAGIDAAWTLKTNKMNLAIPGAQGLLQKHFKDIAEGHVPENYDFNLPDSAVTVLGENNTIYGNSKGTFLKTAALTLYATCTRKRLSDRTFLESEVTKTWIDTTAMAHVVPLPNSVNLLTLDERFSSFTYSYSDTTTPRGFVYIHSGYGFGGHRNELRYPLGKAWGPEDCSSWISKITRSSCIYTTVDQLYQYRTQIQEGLVPDAWHNEPNAKAMKEAYEVVRVRDPQRDIRPGQILCGRAFNPKEDSEMLTSAGVSGHTALVLGFNSQERDSSIVVMAYDRNMPNVEGFGVQQFPLDPGPSRKMMLFSMKGLAHTTANPVAISTVSSPTVLSPNR